MRTYNIVLFIHLLGVVSLFGALAISQRAGAGVRKATTVADVRTWLTLLRSTGPVFPISGVVLLASGLYMVADVWSFTTPWVVVAFWGLVVLQAVGGAVVDARFKKIGALSEGQEAGIPPEMARLIDDPVLWSSALALNAIALGILWLMANKPDWAESIGVVVGLAVVGAVGGYMSAGSRSAATPSPRT